MRKVAVQNLQPGMFLEKPVYTKGGRILLDRGVKLTESYIRRLGEFGIPFVYIWDERIAEIEIDDSVNDETRLRAAEIVHESMEKIRLGKGLDTQEIKKMVEDIIKQILDNSEALLHLSEIRIAGEQLFHHSVNVAIYAILTGVNVRYGEKELLELGTGALLHDIGKSRLPARILNSPEPSFFSDCEEFRNHTSYGFEIMRRENNLSLLSAHVAYQHHECYDGTGYPRGLKGEEIHEYARIAAIANTYDILVSGLYGKRLAPYQTIEYIIAQAGRAFDPKLARIFSTNIAVYPLGSLVRLNTGQKGFVIHIPKNYPTRPIVRLIADADGKKYTGNYPEINLLQELTVFVEEVLEEES